METINGLPAHVLLVHAVVVLIPLTGLLLVLVACWPAARRSLIWLVTASAVITMILTPLTADAGEALAQRFGSSEALRTHTERGDTLTWFVVPLLLLAGALLAVHLRERGGKPLVRPLLLALALLTLVAASAATIQVYRVGDSGARAVWGAYSGTAPS